MSTPASFYPWQRETAQAWLSNRERFAHAWLVHGMPGIGKRTFALAAAASMLCQQPREGLACQQCQSCQWVASGNHPDFRRLRPDAVALEEGAPDSEAIGTASTRKNPSREIRIDQLRELEDWFGMAPHQGGWRVLVLYPAQALNVVSANALLKTLEEPGPQTLFILVADAPDRLLPTIVSRCRRLPLPVPDIAQSLAWLREQNVSQPQEWLAAASQAPVAAARLAQTEPQPCPAWLTALLQCAQNATSEPDIGPIADELEKLPVSGWLTTLQRATLDMQLHQAGLEMRYYPGLEPALTLATGAHAGRLSGLSRWLAEQQSLASHPLSERLFVHTILQQTVLAWRQ
ncbi:MAG TPA: DNA polymerase III subunit delta' [Burkholderiaceae bacterium]|nr:DNA polymerase III subunit delta' [Burkholderiaceae bacterium]